MRYVEQLSRDLELWVSEGLISREQADAIRARRRDDDVGERRGRVVNVLAVVGALVAGLGVILFFAANWDAIPRPVRVAVLLGALLGSYAVGYVLRHVRARQPHVGHALLFLGGILFGASLFLVGQMYHVQAHDPLAFLIWTAAVAPLAVVLDSRPLATLSLLTFGAWMLYELVERGSDDFGVVAYLPALFALYGAALYGFGTWAAPRLEQLAFRAPMRWLGYAFCALGTFLFTFRFVFDELDERPDLGRFVWVALAALAAAAIGGAAALALGRRRGTAAWEALALGAVAVAVVLAIVVPEATQGDESAVLYPVLFNLLLVALALGAVLVGYANDEPWLVNLGLVFVGVEIFARYVDFFWEILPRSLVFVGAGVLLLVLAFVLERQRSRLVARMEQG